MKITNVEINNFRGIKHACIDFPTSTRIICLVGPGDCGKSTLLTAIEWGLWPSWNLIASDTDFYNCDSENTISIDVSVAELPDALLKEDKYGLFLRNASNIKSNEDDEPTDNGIVVLTIRLTIDATLEPKWEVITNRTESKPISHKDRRMLSFGAVGFDHEKDFLWGRNSILQKYADSKDTLHSEFTRVMRNAVKEIHLDQLDLMAPTMKEIAGKYGVAFKGDIHNQLLMQNGSYSTTVGVFDDKIPLAQRGLGSKRLLSIGMNINAYSDGTLIVVDELETGLEPHRISALINQFRTQFSSLGQLIMTTHSISAICECNIEEVLVCTNNDGEFEIHYLNQVCNINADIQALLRSCPAAFLSKRIIVCEGKTEVGLLRAFDNYLVTNNHTRFAYYGVNAIPGGGGDNFFQLAELLHDCGYDVCILMDSDIPGEESQKTDMRTKGIPVFDWESGFAIEEQLFNDVSDTCITKMLTIAIQQKTYDHVKNKITANTFHENYPFTISCEDIAVRDHLCTDDRILLGKIAKAKKNEWYKSISTGEMVGNAVFSEFDTMDNCRFKEQMLALKKWVIGYDA